MPFACDLHAACLCYSFLTTWASKLPLESLLSLPEESGLGTSPRGSEQSQATARLCPLLEVPSCLLHGVSYLHSPSTTQNCSWEKLETFFLLSLFHKTLCSKELLSSHFLFVSSHIVHTHGTWLMNESTSLFRERYISLPPCSLKPILQGKHSTNAQGHWWPITQVSKGDVGLYSVW